MLIVLLVFLLLILIFMCCKASLEVCGTNPMTGYFRDGYCRTDSSDSGKHTVCATLTDDFLNFTRANGNPLSGLKAGDNWCICESRWLEAKKAGIELPIKLEASNILL